MVHKSNTHKSIITKKGTLSLSDYKNLRHNPTTRSNAEKRSAASVINMKKV